MWNLFGVVVFHTSMINWGRGKLIWWVQVIWKCMNVKMTLCSTPWSPDASMLNSCSVMVFQRSMVTWGVHLTWVDVHVKLYSIHLWSIGGGGPWYMCILLYVQLIQCSGIPHIYDWLEGISSSDGYRSSENVWMWRWPYVVLPLVTRCLYVKLMQCNGIPEIYGHMGGTSDLGRCAFCYMWNLFGVVVFHTSMVNWRRGPWYMCILLYVQLIQCSGIPHIYDWLEGDQLIWWVQVIWKCMNVKMTLCSTPLGHQMPVC